MQLNEFKTYLLIKRAMSETTVEKYLFRVKAFLDKNSELNQETIDKHFEELYHELKDNEKFSPYVQDIKALKNYAKFLKVDIEFPAYRKSKRKKINNLSRDEIEKEIIPYFKHLFERDFEKRIFVFRFMFLTLLRKSEVVNIKRKDVDLEERRINIFGKGKKNRTVYIHKSLVDELKKYVEGKNEEEYIFNIKAHYIDYIFKKINNELNYKKKVTPHTTRRAGGRYLRDNGYRIEHISNMMGHSNINTTIQYLNYEMDEVQKEFDKIPYKKG